jgi:hypothetical protein
MADDTGLASGIANDAAVGFAFVIIVVDLLVILPLALFAMGKLLDRSDRTELLEDERPQA